jgi:hypothetical protein
LDGVLSKKPGAVVPWTGRQMVVATFVTHLRSELALHRWDLVGDDEVSAVLLAQDSLTDHAVSVLGRPLLVRSTRGRLAPTEPLRLTLAAPGRPDIAVGFDQEGARLEAVPYASPSSRHCLPVTEAGELFSRRRRPQVGQRITFSGGSRWPMKRPRAAKVSDPSQAITPVAVRATTGILGLSVVPATT